MYALCIIVDLGQPAARQTASGEKLSPAYVFSTIWANKAALAVKEGIFESLIEFHKAQPKGPGYLTLDYEDKQSSSSLKEPSESESEKEFKPLPQHKQLQRGKTKGPSQRGRDTDSELSPGVPVPEKQSVNTRRKTERGSSQGECTCTCGCLPEELVSCFMYNAN